MGLWQEGLTCAAGDRVNLLVDATEPPRLHTRRVRLIHRLWPVLLSGFLLLWLMSSLLLMALRGEIHPGDYALLLAVPVAAKTGMVRVSGTPQHGLYLLRKRVHPSIFDEEGVGWHTVWQGGNGYAFARGKERLSGSCGRFGRFFEACNLAYWMEK